MEDFKKIYEILRILQRSMDCEEFDKESLSPERLGMSVPRWNRIMAILVDEGFISGVEVWESMDCSYPRVLLTRPEITLKGLEYLEDNSVTKKFANLAKGIKEIVPGI